MAGIRHGMQDRLAARAGRWRGAGGGQVDWRKRMSNHVACALLVYTALQIAMTMNAMAGDTPSLLPYLSLVVLVAAIIPACRYFEGRWNRLDDEAARNPAFAMRFRRDRLALWLLAIGLPFGLTGLFRLLSIFFAG